MTDFDMAAWRRRLGITQDRARRLFGVNLSTFKRWEWPTCPPPPLHAVQQARALERLAGHEPLDFLLISDL